MGMRELRYWAELVRSGAFNLDQWAGAATKVRALLVAGQMVAVHAAETEVEVQRYRQMWIATEYVQYRELRELEEQLRLC